MCHAALDALLSVSGQPAVTLAALFDNEEIGSRTPQGADSAFLEHVMERIVLACGGSRGGLSAGLQRFLYDFGRRRPCGSSQFCNSS